MTNDIAVTAPTEIMRLAIDKGADLDKLEKLMILQERWAANEARKAYHQAMAEFKANPPKINKDKAVSFGQGKAAYNHASLGNVTEKISTELSKYGLSASWTTNQTQNADKVGIISVTCRLTHCKGHSEETTLSSPADSSGSKNGIQAIGSTITYLERYTILALTGLATFEQDDDGQAAVTEFISKEELSQILDLVAEKEVNLDKFLAYLKVESLEKMPKSIYQKAVAALNSKVKR